MSQDNYMEQIEIVQSKDITMQNMQQNEKVEQKTVAEVLGDEMVMKLYDLVVEVCAPYRYVVRAADLEEVVDKVFDHFVLKAPYTEDITQNFGVWRSLFSDYAWKKIADIKELGRSDDVSLEAVEEARGEEFFGGKGGARPFSAEYKEAKHRALERMIVSVFNKMNASDSTREVFIRNVWMEQEYSKIAADLGITENACYQKVSRVLKNIKKYGKEYYLREREYCLAYELAC